MARQAENSEVTGAFVTPGEVTPGERAGWVRTGADTAVPTLIQAVLFLADPEVQVHMLIRVKPGGRAHVSELLLAPGDVTVPITTSMLRRIPVDALMRDALERATVKVKLRPDIHERAFQVPGDPDGQAWVTPEPAPLGRGREVPADRVVRAAETYKQALASGSSAPAEVVAATLGYSRATAARDIRAARKRGLLAPLGEERALATESGWPAVGSASPGDLGSAEDSIPVSFAVPADRERWRRFREAMKDVPDADPEDGLDALSRVDPKRLAPTVGPRLLELARYLERVEAERQEAALRRASDEPKGEESTPGE